MSIREQQRLQEEAERRRNWKRWGPYLADRQWGTVREDYSARGEAWDYFPHEHARSRAYRWGEDGLLGITDRQCRLCFALALWNGEDPFLKERLFGLTNSQGNHGEDVKECYYYLDATPTHSFARALYKYPQVRFPYEELVRGNQARSRLEPELELHELGVFDRERYFDIEVRYGKAGEDDILIQLLMSNRGDQPAALHVLPTLWFRNTWSWGRDYEDNPSKPRMSVAAQGTLLAEHPTLGTYELVEDAVPWGVAADLLFTENETNRELLFGVPNETPYVKDAFHRYVVQGEREACNPAQIGTKAALHRCLTLAPGTTSVWNLRLAARSRAEMPPPDASQVASLLEERHAEADAFYNDRIALPPSSEGYRVARQAYAGLMWTKQFYFYVVKDWLEGDPSQPAPPPERAHVRNAEWKHLFTRDVLSMPDKWEYPWFAAWDLAFHMVAMAEVDAHFAKAQLVLLLREWYMRANGQIPAYEWEFGDVNPPVHAWAAWRVYKIEAARGKPDRAFLASVFQKLLINFTWWVNRKDTEGNNLFSGGFLGLDNIGVFDRSKPLPSGGHLQQADGTAWMAVYALVMLPMALELAQDDPAYEDMASKFFEHFIEIVDAINSLGGTGLWDEEDGFYYDRLRVNGGSIPLRVRSMVGLIPLLATNLLRGRQIEKLPGFFKRMQWFLKHRPELAKNITSHSHFDGSAIETNYLLSIMSRGRLELILDRLLDEQEFLSPFGIRSLSRFHESHPFLLHAGGELHRVDYEPGESRTWLFGGNSNWRGPIWIPLNYMLVEALERYHRYYGSGLQVECPKGSGVMMTLEQVAAEINRRLCRLVLPDDQGRRPAHGEDYHYSQLPHWRELVLFYEYFHADTGAGLGASHQTGWTALLARMLEDEGAGGCNG